LQDILIQKKITSVVDMGCGDWQFSQFIDWSGITYQGYDVVPAVVSANKYKHAKQNVSFHLYSADPKELPVADLLIAKDVLQHLPNQIVLDFLPNLSKYKYALLTNCTNPKGEDVNGEIAIGGFRYLDLRLPPFNLNATEVYSFRKVENNFLKKLKTFIRGYPRWKKIVLLVDNSGNSQALSG
jgi:hypothetical protein